MVRRNDKIVDIGTDHAYLPAYLILSGKVLSVLACDIGENPLENARKTVELYSLDDKIELRISDGLKSVNPNEAEEIVICGMGGTLISEILSAASWIKRDGMHLILQPMTHSEEVRMYLSENGFFIDAECHVIEKGRAYCCISAVYTGKNENTEDGYLYFGTLPPENEAAQIFTSARLKRLDTKIKALEKNPDEREMFLRLLKIREYYDKRMKQ